MLQQQPRVAPPSPVQSLLACLHSVGHCDRQLVWGWTPRSRHRTQAPSHSNFKPIPTAGELGLDPMELGPALLGNYLPNNDFNDEQGVRHVILQQYSRADDAL